MKRKGSCSQCIRSAGVLRLNKFYKNSLSTHDVLDIGCTGLSLDSFSPFWWVSQVSRCHRRCNGRFTFRKESCGSKKRGQRTTEVMWIEGPSGRCVRSSRAGNSEWIHRVTEYRLELVWAGWPGKCCCGHRIINMRRQSLWIKCVVKEASAEITYLGHQGTNPPIFWLTSCRLIFMLKPTIVTICYQKNILKLRYPQEEHSPMWRHVLWWYIAVFPSKGPYTIDI